MHTESWSRIAILFCNNYSRQVLCIEKPLRIVLKSNEISRLGCFLMISGIHKPKDYPDFINDILDKSTFLRRNGILSPFNETFYCKCGVLMVICFNNKSLPLLLWYHHSVKELCEKTVLKNNL